MVFKACNCKDLAIFEVVLIFATVLLILQRIIFLTTKLINKQKNY